MGRMADYEEREWSAGRPYLLVGRWEGESHKSRESTFRNPLAAVQIYEWLDRENRPRTHMRFQRDGREWGRFWDHGFGDRTLARLAREFVEEKTGLKCNG